MRNAKAFRGGATTTAPPFNGADLLNSKTFRWNVLDKATPPSFLYSLYKTDIFFDRLNALSTVLERAFLTQKNSPDESRSCTVFIKYRLAAMWRIKPAQSRWATARRFHAPCVRQSAHLMRREVCNPPMETESLNKSVGL